MVIRSRCFQIPGLRCRVAGQILSCLSRKAFQYMIEKQIITSIFGHKIR